MYRSLKSVIRSTKEQTWSRSCLFSSASPVVRRLPLRLRVSGRPSSPRVRPNLESYTVDLLEPSSPVCKGVHLNRNDSRCISARWSPIRITGEREREKRGEAREKERAGEGKVSNWRRNVKYHCLLYNQEHNLTKLLAHSDLLPPRDTGSFLIHVSDGVTLLPPSVLCVFLSLSSYSSTGQMNLFLCFDLEFSIFYEACCFALGTEYHW